MENASLTSASRRTFLKTTLVGGLLGTGGILSAQTAPAVTPTRRRAKNLIFLVSDGMNNGTLALANHYCEIYRGQSCEWVGLMKDAGRGLARALMKTDSASSLVTDSAAAGSAWSCGQRIPNGSLNVDGDGKDLTPIYHYVHDAGKWTGLATTTRITHATPASFAINHKERNDEDIIAKKYLDSGVGILLGGGSRHFDAAQRGDGLDLTKEFAGLGYKVMNQRDELVRPFEPGHEPTSCPKLLGTFWESHLPYTIDWNHNAAMARRVPTLAEMTEAALARLKYAPEGFVLQVEGGRVDHAGHANDAGAILWDQLAFDECIPVARRFAEANPDTLVIVTTDHGTGGCHLNGMGNRYNDTPETFAKLRDIRASFEHLGDQISDRLGDVSAVRQTLTQGLGLDVPVETAGAIVEKLKAGQKYAASAELASIMYPHTGVNFTSNQHTGDLVEFLAFGPGAELVPLYLENYEVQGLMREALGV